MSEAAEIDENLDTEIAEELQIDETQKEAEEQARTQGWAPKEEWRGPEEQWVDAETFLERGKENNAILRERNDSLLKEIQTIKTEFRNSVKEFGDAQRKTEERAYQKAMQDILAKQEQAVEMGDVAGWKALEGSKRELEDSKPKKPEDKPNPDQDPNFISWLPNNEWYDPKSDKYDIELSSYAEQIAPAVSRKYGNGNEFYAKVSECVKQKFPEKFGNQRRSRLSQVEGSTSLGGKQKTGKSYDDLPPEAKSICDRYVSQGLMKQDEYLKEYFAQ